MNSHFARRTISTVNDLSVDEQIYLYEKTRALKEAIENGRDTAEFRIDDPELAVYLFFMEDSTRTKESFRNAAKFHNVKINDFDAINSSFNKKETITDTIKMLFGYSKRSIFITRSKQEGMCRWLEEALGHYADKIKRPRPSFINGGDGRHEHPTQEFLDEFSFLEQLNWKRDKIRLALVGDLFHGRTVHSKVDGLKIYDKVAVDLVAPEELAMPKHYIDKMKEYGYTVNTFSSIEEYLDSGETAEIWYFTRLQLERMGDKVLEKAEQLRSSVTFKKELLSRVSSSTRFYHPLPRHGITPTIPSFLDNTHLNGWDLQSINGYYTRVIEIAMTGGKLGSDFTGRSLVPKEFPDDFVEEVSVQNKKKPEYKVGIKPVENGIVIDHISRGKTPKEIWDHIDKIRRILDLNKISSHGVFQSQKSKMTKGIISVPDLLELDIKELKKLGAVSPGCTFNIVKDQQVLKKFRMQMPPRIYNFKEISCKNNDCISSPQQHEHVIPEFFRLDEESFICKYCEKPHKYEDIWE